MAAPGVAAAPSAGKRKGKSQSKSLWGRLTKKNGQASSKKGGQASAKKGGQASSGKKSGRRSSAQPSSSGGGSGASAPSGAGSGPGSGSAPAPSPSGGQTTPRPGRKSSAVPTPETAPTMASLTPGSGGVELPEPLFPAFQGEDGGVVVGDHGAPGASSPDVPAPSLTPSRRSGHRRPSRDVRDVPSPSGSPPTPSRFGVTVTPTKSAHGPAVHSASKSLASGLREQPTLSTASMTATHGERSGVHRGDDGASAGRTPRGGGTPEAVTPRSRSTRDHHAGASRDGDWTPLKDGGWTGGRARTLPAVG